MVPEFILCKGKAVEESWVFRENKETSLARARKNGRNKRKKDRTGPSDGGSRSVSG